MGAASAAIVAVKLLRRTRPPVPSLATVLATAAAEEEAVQAAAVAVAAEVETWNPATLEHNARSPPRLASKSRSDARAWRLRQNDARAPCKSGALSLSLIKEQKAKKAMKAKKIKEVGSFPHEIVSNVRILAFAAAVGGWGHHDERLEWQSFRAFFREQSTVRRVVNVTNLKLIFGFACSQSTGQPCISIDEFLIWCMKVAEKQQEGGNPHERDDCSCEPATSKDSNTMQCAGPARPARPQKHATYANAPHAIAASRRHQRQDHADRHRRLRPKSRHLHLLRHCHPHYQRRNYHHRLFHSLNDRCRLTRLPRLSESRHRLLHPLLQPSWAA